MKKLIVLIIIALGLNASAQQEKVLEEIVAVVGDNIILKTELETEYLQALETMEIYEGDLKCEILNQLIIQKLYLHKADVDSVYADDSRVEAEVERRIQYYASQLGSEARLEKYLGKSIEEYKNQMRSKIKDQMVAQEVQQGLIANVKISPTEVNRFFKDIPKDSLPFIEPEVELAQIVMKPEPNDFAKEYAKSKLEDIRAELLAGKTTFEIAAKSKK